MSASTPYTLPTIEAPDLDNLEVMVAAPAPPTTDELMLRLHQTLRANAPRRERARDESLEVGDEVDCDIVASIEGRLLAGCVQRHRRLELREMPHLPGLAEAFVGMTPFSHRSVELTLPTHYPLAELAGKAAVFELEVRQAFAIDMSELADPHALREANLGESIEEAMDTLAEEIAAEQANELFADATQAVLDALAERVQVEIPAAAIDDELRLSWESSCGSILGEKSVSEEAVAKGLEEFLSSAELRADAGRRIKASLALYAIIDREQIVPAVEDVEEFLESANSDSGLTPTELRQAIAEDPLAYREVAEAAVRIAGIEYVMEHAKITVIDGD